jgi:hypothetical protein
MDGPEYALLYDHKRRKSMRLQCAKPLKRRVMTASELLEAEEDEAEESGEEN